MAVPTPQRHYEAIALIPVELVAVDDRRPAPSEGMIDSAAVVSVSPGRLSVAEQLNTAGERGHGMRALGVHVFQRHAIEWACGTVAEPF